jgi:hypothetical protein
MPGFLYIWGMTVKTCVGYISQHDITQYGIAAWAAMWLLRAADAERKGNGLRVYEMAHNEVSADLGNEMDYVSELVMPPDGQL